MAFNPLAPKGGDSKAKPAGNPALSMSNANAPGKVDLSAVTSFGKNMAAKWSAQPSVVGKTDGSGTSPRKVDTAIPFQAIMAKGPKGSSKTIGAIDVRNAWWAEQLAARGQFRTLVLSYDSITRQSAVSYHGSRVCVEKGLVGKRGELSLEDIEREGAQWLADNDITIWEMTSPVYGKDGEELLYPGFDPNVPETASFVIGETARILDQYFKTGRPHHLIVDHHQLLYEDIGTSHVLAQTNAKPGSKIKDFDWAHRTTAMNALKNAFFGLPTMCLTSTGYPGEVKYRISVDGEDKRERYYDEPRWVKANWRNYNLQVVSEYKDPVDKEGAPVRDGPAREFEVWVQSSQTTLVRQGQQLNITGSGFSKLYEERRPKEKKEEKK